jgi:ADP-ribosylglycohydrolase
MSADRARFRGCLLGLASGDALGTTLEFKAPGSFEPIEGLVGGGPFGLRPGEWTDDTSMALCLAESLIEKPGFDPDDQMARYVRWWREGHLSSTGHCFDIGTTVTGALRRFGETCEPFSGSEDPNTAGNGSLMRLAPVPMLFAGDAQSAIEHAALSSRTTHGAQTAVDACRYFAGVLWGALAGQERDTILSPLYHPVLGRWDDGSLHPEVSEVAGGSFARNEPPDIVGNGYVVRSLEAALWAFHRSSSFEDGALMAVNLGNDADTTGAIYGQIAGAYYGESGIPGPWLSVLAQRDLIESFADRLAELASGH